MKNNLNITLKSTAIATLASMLVFVVANAQTNTVKHTNLNRSASSSVERMIQREARQASSTEKRIIKGQDMINQRVSSLGELISRIQNMKNLSDAGKMSLIASLRSEITSLNTLEGNIASTTSTSTLKSEIESITNNNRVYALVEPQTQIMAAADRITTLVISLNAIYTKVNARLGSSTNSTVAGSLSDFSVKITDATAQANAATALVSNLKPDNGDKTIAASNKTALKSAHSNIVIAQKDIQAARADIKSVIETLTGNHSDNNTSAEATSSSR